MAFEFPLARGNYTAKITDSNLVRYDQDNTSLSLWLTCANRNGICTSAMSLLIHQPDQEAQQIERDLLQSMARAMGVAEFEDTDDLHGCPFRQTIWRERPMRFSCRPAP